MKVTGNDSKVNNQKIFLHFITKLYLQKADENNDKDTNIILKNKNEKV
jgi:hypothetical protein